MSNQKEKVQSNRNMFDSIKIKLGLKQAAYPTLESMNKKTKQEIQDTQQRIFQQIEDINKNLGDAYKKQENILIKYYETEIQQTEKEFADLSSKNEEELQKKWEEKKLALQTQRIKALEDALEFSTKCKKFKNNLQEVLRIVEVLDEELEFLDERLVYADMNNAKVKEELKKLKEQIIQFEPNYIFEEESNFWECLPAIQCSTTAQNKNQNSSILSKFLPQLDKQKSQMNNSCSRRSSSLTMRSKQQQYKSPYSQENMALSYLSKEQKIIFLEEQIKSEEIVKKRLEELIQDQCFEESQFERMFLETVEAVRSQSKNNSKFIKLPNLHNKFQLYQYIYIQRFDSLIKETEFQLDQEQQQQQQETLPSFLQNSLYLSGNVDTTSFEKKQIIEMFLNNIAVKRFIYDMISEKRQEQKPSQELQEPIQSQKSQ